MSTAKNTTEITLLGQKYPIACSPEEQDNLLRAANFLNKKLRETREGSKVYNLEKIALLTALNLSNELLKLQQNYANHDSKTSQLNQQMDSALNMLNSLVSKP